MFKLLFDMLKLFYIHREGQNVVFFTGIFCFLLYVTGFFNWVVGILMIIVVLYVFVVYNERTVYAPQHAKNVVVSPIDGYVANMCVVNCPHWFKELFGISEATEMNYLVKVKLCTTVFSNRIARSPATGTIEKQVSALRKDKKFIKDIYRGCKSGLFTHMLMDDCDSIFIAQCSMLFPQSLQSVFFENDMVHIGEETNIMPMCGVTVLFFPFTTEIYCVVGQRLIAGESILGIVNSKKGTEKPKTTCLDNEKTD